MTTFTLTTALRTGIPRPVANLPVTAGCGAGTPISPGKGPHALAVGRWTEAQPG